MFYFFIVTICIMFIYILLNIICNKNYYKSMATHQKPKNKKFYMLNYYFKAYFLYISLVLIIIMPITLTNCIKNYSSPESYSLWVDGSLDYNFKTENEKYFLGFEQKESLSPTLLYKNDGKYKDAKINRISNKYYYISDEKIYVAKYSIKNSNENLLILRLNKPYDVYYNNEIVNRLGEDMLLYYYIFVDENKFPIEVDINGDVIDIE